MVDILPMGELPTAPFERILRKAGAERVSAEAAAELAEAVEDVANDMAVKMVRFMRHAGRRTVKAADVELVAGRKE